MKRVLYFSPLLLLAGCSHEDVHAKAKAEKPATPVRVAQIEMYEAQSGARYSATITPGRQVSLGFRVSGIVSGIYRTGGRGLEPGDMVSAGAVLAKLREEDYGNTTAQSLSQLDSAREANKAARAQLEQSEAAHRKAEADFVRAKALMETQSLTRPEFDAAKAQFDVTAAQVAAARAQIDATAAQVRTAEASNANARLNQGDTILAAPFAAAIVQRNVEVGMLAGPTQAAYVLADITTVKVNFGVPDTIAVQLKPGTSIGIHVEALPGADFRGSITAVAAVADADTRLFQVEVALLNPRLLLKPGMIASLALEQRESKTGAVPVIPMSAVVRDAEDPSGFTVMVVENRAAKARRVTLGQAFGDVLAVTSGLQPGDVVIRSGATLVKNGEPVEVIQ